ncbi:tetratricopeptide repeat protein [Alloiococcus sp. CFN-8]|uniref:tetratricopeptide repeat protein n=1 Tax=Alloiococcus sp. CFN-8 TaxID=3416081 RepID=UPI003CEF314A
MEFLTQGEKLKKLRLELNLRQKDLSDDKVTREFISMVEKGKRNFSKGNAIKVMRKLLDIAKEKEIDLELDEEYMARDINEDAELYCIRRVENKASLEECEKLLKIAEEHKAHYAKSRIYKRMGELQLYNQEAVQAFISNSSALEILNLNNIVKDKPIIFNNMGVCKLMLMDYEEAVFYFKNSLMISEIINDYKIYNRCLFNLALAYSHLDNLPETLKTLDRCITRLDKVKEFKLYVKAKILEAHSYSRMDENETALRIYKDVDEDYKYISELSNEDEIVLANLYNNIGYSLLSLGRYEESEIYFDKSIVLREKYSIEDLSHTLITKSVLYIKTEQYEKSLECLHRGIDLCREYNDYEYWNIALRDQEKVNLIKNDIEGLRQTYLQYIELSGKNNNENTRIYGYNKLMRLELLLNNTSEAMKYSDKLNAYIEEIQSNTQLQW